MKRELNLPLFEAVKKKILEEPRNFDMTFFVKEDGCGTTCCIGGWASILADGERLAEVKKKYLSNIFYTATELLGLTADQASRLFYDMLTGFSPGTREYAQAGAALIDRCIAEFQAENARMETIEEVANG